MNAVPLRVLDLFSGIGGFSLGLERAGMRTVAFCEIEPFARRVLRKHWPEVPIYDDVRSLTADALRRDGITVDLICGGFPCQDISAAGTGLGLAGTRSGLWSEFSRLIGQIRPRFAIVENVADLLHRGFGHVLGCLAGHGYDAEWHRIRGAEIGAPHRRDRLFIVAYPNGQGGLQPGWPFAEIGRWVDDGSPASPWADAWQEKLSQIEGMDDGPSTRLDSAAVGALGNSVFPIVLELIGRPIMAAEREEGLSQTLSNCLHREEG